MNKALVIFLILHLLTLSTSFAAGVFRIVNRNYGNLSDPTYTAEVDNVFNTMETEVNSQLGQFDTSSYLESTANATALASAGGTHDLANRFRYFYISLGASLAADLGGANFADLGKPDAVNSAKGVSGNLNLNIGAPGHILNLPKIGSFKPENSKVYLGYTQYSRTIEDVNFDYLTFSLMGQYRFLDEQSLFLGAMKWNGIQVTSGFKYSRIKILYSKQFSETVQQTINGPGGATDMTMTYNSTAQLGATAAISTIPIEASTSVKLLYFLDGFVGVASDLNFGSAESIVSAPGSVTATEQSNTLGTMSGDIELDLGQNGKAQSVSGRYLVGLAFDLRVLSLTLQYNHNVTNSAEALHIGLAAHF